ncbi:hypothetical protein, partial [Aeromonas taiwanensis]
GDKIRSQTKPFFYLFQLVAAKDPVHVPGYCYVLCDLTESMHRRCRRANLRITSDGMGYFGYNEPSHAYIEVISFDQLVKAAKERNRAFFDKLGLPST